MTKIVVFTGVPGTRLTLSASKLADYIAQPHINRSATVYCLEEEFWYLFRAELNNDPYLKLMLGFEENITEEEKPDWWKILKLPIEKIRNLWEDAFTRVLETKIKKTNTDYCFLTLHMLFFSDDYKWGVSAVNPILFSKLSSIHTFINLIDDVYDLHLLRTPDNKAIIDKVSQETSPWGKLINLLELTTNLLIQYIRLRQEETFLSDSLAFNFGQKSNVFSVKHPIETIAKLIESPSQSVYFSHPISAVRRNIKAKNLDNFGQDSLFKEINKTAKILREQYPLIEPTTIDELRIKTIFTGESDLQELYLPILDPRWGFIDMPSNLLNADEFGEGLCSLISDDEITELGIKNEWDLLVSGKAPKHIQYLCSAYVKQLATAIKQDINWRDHHLVGQTKHLFVYRPTTNGQSSSGVKREIQYFSKVTRLLDSNKSCVVYYPNDEIVKTAIHSAKELLNELVENDDTSAKFQKFINLPENKKNDIINEIANSIQTIQDIYKTSDNIVEILKKRSLITYLNKGRMTSSTDNPMASGIVTNFRMKEEKINNLFKNMIIQILIQLNHYIEYLRASQQELNLGFFDTDIRAVEHCSTIFNKVK